MIKPESLRRALLAYVPELSQDPEKMLIFADRGHLITTGANGDSWEYSYQLTIMIQDFAGDMDLLAATVLDWLSKEQPDLLKNPQGRERGVRFEAQLMTSELADVQLELDVSEPVIRTPGGFQHPAPPPRDPTALW